MKKIFCLALVLASLTAGVAMATIAQYWNGPAVQLRVEPGQQISIDFGCQYVTVDASAWKTDGSTMQGTKFPGGSVAHFEGTPIQVKATLEDNGDLKLEIEGENTQTLQPGPGQPFPHCA